MRYTIKTSGLMCGHCDATVETALLNVAGVTDADADHETQTVQVECADTVTAEQRGLDGGIAMAAHEAGSLDCETHGYSSLLCRLSQAPDLDLQAVARVPKYASLLFQVNLGHLENPF